MSPAGFFAKMGPFAASASVRLNIPAQVILAQWALESAYGGSALARESNNYAGIKYTSHADGKNGSYAAYSSVNSFVDDYVRVLSGSAYDDVRGASGVADTVDALARSPYAGDAQYGDKIMRILNSRDVTTTTGLNIFGVFTKVLGSPLVWLGLLFWLLFKK